MNRKPALAIAASAAMVGAAGLVTAAALSGVGILGFHVGAAKVAAPATTAPAVDDATTSVPAPPPTLAPVVVVQTEYVDQIVTVTSAAGAPVGASPASWTPDDEGDGGAPTPAAAPPAATPAPTPAPTAAPTTPAPTAPAPVVTTAAPTTPAPTQPPTTTTVFDRAAYPFKISIPAEWGTKPVPAPPTPAAGRQWKECELHTQGYWECQYP